MFMSTTEAALVLNMSDRQVRRAVDAGHIQAERVANRYVLYERQVYAYKRSSTRGRAWSLQTQSTALDLLSQNSQQRMIGSSLSRLKARLRTMDTNALARQLLTDNVRLYDGGSNTRERLEPDVAQAMGLVGPGLQVLVAQNSQREAAKRRLSSNPNGNVVVIEGQGQHRQLFEALALRTYGDTRERSAAQLWLAQRQSSI